MDPVPLIFTEIDYLYANKFPLKDKVIYTLYNKNSDTVRGKLIEVDHRDRSHYVDLFYDKEVEAKVCKKNASLYYDIPADQVVAVAQFPRILNIQKNESRINIKIERKLKLPKVVVFFGDDSNTGKVLTVKNNQAILCPGKMRSGGKMIIKLFDEDYLADEVIVNEDPATVKN